MLVKLTEAYDLLKYGFGLPKNSPLVSFSWALCFKEFIFNVTFVSSSLLQMSSESGKVSSVGSEIPFFYSLYSDSLPSFMFLFVLLLLTNNYSNSLAVEYTFGKP